MPYTTQQEMIDRFGEAEVVQLTDRDGSAGAIVAQVLDQAIADADAEIDGYLAGGGYTLPLASVPAILSRIGADITRYHLYDDAATEDVRRRYDRAVALLAAIAKGTVSLGAGDPQGSADAPQTVAPTRVFTRDDLEDF